MKKEMLTAKSHTILTISPAKNEYSLDCRELFFKAGAKEKREIKELEAQSKREAYKMQAFGMIAGGCVVAFLAVTLIILFLAV